MYYFFGGGVIGNVVDGIVVCVGECDVLQYIQISSYFLFIQREREKFNKVKRLGDSAFILRFYRYGVIKEQRIELEGSRTYEYMKDRSALH